MRALIIAHGEPPSPGLLRSLAARADLVVGADGGGDVALAAGITPDAVVGDLDGLSADARAILPEGTVHQVDDRNTTDLEKAVAFAAARGATRIDITAAGGGRLDHTFGNLSVLCRHRAVADLRIIDDLFEVRRVDGEAAVAGPEGTVVSLVAIGTCEGVTTHGLRWPLTDYRLEFSPYGVHNEVVSQPARVTVRSGDLLLFEGRWTEKHT